MHSIIHTYFLLINIFNQGILVQHSMEYQLIEKETKRMIQLVEKENKMMIQQVEKGNKTMIQQVVCL